MLGAVDFIRRFLLHGLPAVSFSDIAIGATCAPSIVASGDVEQFVIHGVEGQSWWYARLHGRKQTIKLIGIPDAGVGKHRHLILLKRCAWLIKGDLYDRHPLTVVEVGSIQSVFQSQVGHQ